MDPKESNTCSLPTLIPLCAPGSDVTCCTVDPQGADVTGAPGTDGY